MSATAPPALRWRIPQVPAHWQVVPGWGLRGVGGVAAGSNICLTEDTLLAGNKLEPYVKVQMTLLQKRLAMPQFAGPSPTAMLAASGVEDAALLLIRHAAPSTIAQLQVYGRLGKWIGIATLTAMTENVAPLRKDFELFLTALRVSPAPTGS